MNDLTRFMTDLSDTHWRELAACIGKMDLFFPRNPMSGPIETRGAPVVIRNRIYQAKEICANCPVKVECEEFHMRTRPSDGVWAGLDEAERRRIYKRHDTARRAANRANNNKR